MKRAPFHLHHTLDEDARRHHVVGRDRAQRHDAVDLHDGRARGHAHHRAEVASGITIGQVAPAVGLERLHERIVAGQRLLEHVALAVDDARLLAFGQLAAVAHRREEGPQPGRRGAHAFDHDALRHALELDLAGAVDLGKRGGARLRRIGRARERADQLAHAAGQEQLRQPDRPVAAVVVDHREFARALVEQRAQQLGGDARGTEAAHQQRGAVGHVFHGVGQRRNGLVEHGAILIGPGGRRPVRRHRRSGVRSPGGTAHRGRHRWRRAARRRPFWRHAHRRRSARPAAARTAGPCARSAPRTRARESRPAASPSCRGCAARSCRPSPWRASSNNSVGIDARALADRLGLGERDHGLEQHHVVEDLHHLAAADRPAARDVAGEGGDQRPHALEGRRSAPTITDSCPASAAARVRATGASTNIAPRSANNARQRARGVDRRRAEVDHDLARRACRQAGRRVRRRPRAPLRRTAATGTPRRRRAPPRRAMRRHARRARPGAAAARAARRTRAPARRTCAPGCGTSARPSRPGR